MNVYSMLVILGVYSLFAWVILTLLANRRLTNAARIPNRAAGPYRYNHCAGVKSLRSC